MDKRYVFPRSSNIEALEWDPLRNVLRVTFTSGLTYSYEDVSENEFEDLINADSVGSHFYYNIRTSKNYFVSDDELME
jgi:hypothetical protein